MRFSVAPRGSGVGKGVYRWLDSVLSRPRLRRLLPSRLAQSADDAAAVQQAIKDNYAAYSGFDEQRYRATLADDYLLLENGELIDREGDVASMAKPAPVTGAATLSISVR